MPSHTHIIADVVEQLSYRDPQSKLSYHGSDEQRMPSIEKLDEIIGLCRKLLFPGYFGLSGLNGLTIGYHLGTAAERLYILLADQVFSVLHFDNSETCDASSLAELHRTAEEHAARFIEALPELRRLLSTDVIATYNGDPAAESYGEVIYCYPAIRAMINYRVAHQMHQQGIPLIPRILTEMAHSETGIDIHPAATIGEYFSIDHGTGVVIGATAIIGKNVKLYQGVTLGAKSFPLDDEGNPIKGIPRHPILEDDVIIYSNATILGRITIGRGATIGGNIWVTEDVAPNARIVQSKARK